MCGIIYIVYARVFSNVHLLKDALFHTAAESDCFFSTPPSGFLSFLVDTDTIDVNLLLFLLY